MTLKDQIVTFLVQYGFRILGAIAILVCGFFLARLAGKLLKKVIARFQLEPPVESLLVLVARVLVIVLTVVVALEKMGVNIAPLVTGIGVIGVGIGLATQGVLSNLVAGLVIMFAKPFRVTEYIEVLGVEGIVEAIDLSSTHLRHYDRSIVVVPNRKIVGEVLHNYGTLRQLDLRIGVSYHADLGQAEAAIRGALAQNPRILKDPPVVLGLNSLNDSSMCWSVKPWVKVQDFVAAQAELYSAILKNLLAAGIEMPYPQREIRILNDADTRGTARLAVGI